tara:strand:+ start:738 stop:1835 length:1098 start_codon:yes stop_codon:yes gene_type:complete
MIVIGLMSGTSMDGLDCCLSNIEIDEQMNLKFDIIDSDFFPYKKEAKDLIYDTVFYKLHSQEYIADYLGNLYSNMLKSFLSNRTTDLISIHGQTISHKNKQYSKQACNPKIIYKDFSIPVVDNFRMTDINNGGNGAPLVPILDWYLFKNSKDNILTVNIGGISNISFIPNRLEKNKIIGFDTGPGMCIVDRFINKIWKKKYDENGEISNKGVINSELLNYLLKDPFLSLTPPKSATTETYNMKFVDEVISKFNYINNYDILRTFVNFTSVLIKKNIDLFISDIYKNNFKIILSGGGVKNKVLLSDLKNEFIDYDISLLNLNGLNIDNKESFLMCLLGYTRFKNIPNNVPSVTGADSEAVCGDLYE